MSNSTIFKLICCAVLMASAFASEEPIAFRQNGVSFQCVNKLFSFPIINQPFLADQKCINFINGIADVNAAEEIVSAQNWFSCYNSFYDGSETIVYRQTRGSYLRDILYCITFNQNNSRSVSLKASAKSFLEKLVKNLD